MVRVALCVYVFGKSLWQFVTGDLEKKSSDNFGSNVIFGLNVISEATRNTSYRVLPLNIGP